MTNDDFLSKPDKIEGLKKEINKLYKELASYEHISLSFIKEIKE